jgi:hypothetical protein
MKKILAALLALATSAAFAATTVPVQLLNPTGSSSGQAIVSTGTSSAPAWGGIGLNGIAAIAANTVLANATGSSAAPSAFSMPLCNAAGFALAWQTASGFQCNSGYAMTASPTFTGTVTVANLTATGPITPSQTAGIVGTTTNNNANAGSVGEYISAAVGSGSAVSLTTATPTNITSISLTAGDWDVWGATAYIVSAAATQLEGAVNTTSATIPGIATGFGQSNLTVNTAILTNNTLSLAPSRISLSATTTVYLVAQSTFATGTVSAYGFIGARRVR